MTLDPVQFKDIQIALLQQRLVQLQIQETMQQAQAKVRAAMTTAGLDPDKTYTLDETALTAEESV